MSPKMKHFTLMFSTFFYLAAQNAVRSKETTKNPPTIWLERYKLFNSTEETVPDDQFHSNAQFETSFISKNGSDYVASQQVEFVVFSCEANYPITWNFSLSQIRQLEDSFLSAEVQYSDFNSEMSEPVLTRFKISVRVVGRFLSANLPCSSVDPQQTDLQSSVYIFLSENAYLQHQGKLLNMLLKPLKEGESTFVIPCVSSPSTQVQLQKEASNDTTESPVPPQNRTYEPVPEADITFHPKIGFTVKREEDDSKIRGLYRCKVLNNPPEGTIVVKEIDFYVNVTKSNPESTDVETKPNYDCHSTLQGNASVSLDFSRETAVNGPLFKCCSASEETKHALVVHNACISPLHCKITNTLWSDDLSHKDTRDLLQRNQAARDSKNKRGLIAGNCLTSLTHISVSESLMCKGDTVDYLEQLVHLFHPEAGKSPTNRSARIQAQQALAMNSKKKQVTPISQYKILADAEKATIGEKMILLVGGQITGPVTDRHDTLFIDPLENLVFQSDVSAILKKGMPLQFISEYERDFYHEGEPLIFMCFGVRYFYTAEPRLRVNWENGTKTLPELPKHGNVTEMKIARKLYLAGQELMFQGEGNLMVSKFSLPVIVEQGMTSVDCWMPKRENTKWDKISKEIKVLPSTAPKFAEKEEEELHVNLGDAGIVITCNLTDGVPMPGVMATRNGQPIKLTFDKPNSETRKKRTVESNDWNNATTGTESVQDDKHLLNITINFTQITQNDDQTVIQCVAKNVKGTVTRTVRVFVNDFRHVSAIGNSSCEK